MTLRMAWGLLGGLLITLITVLSLIPMGPPPLAIPNGDKLNHALAYITLTWWFGQLWPARRRLYLVLALLGYGVLIELAQGQTGYRSADPEDVLANGVGILLGLALLRTPAGRLYAWLDARRPSP